MTQPSTPQGREHAPSRVHGAGLGLRREILSDLEASHCQGIDFMEVAPENWIGIGGHYGKRFRAMTEQHDFVIHGLSLSIGGPSPLDETLVRDIKQFMREHGILQYTEHLTYCSDAGQLYDLLPIPFTEDAVHYVAERIKRVQDILEQRIGIENASYYAMPKGELSEIEFIRAVIDEADCDLLLDVNNIYVNSVNHGYDAEAFLRQMPGERIAYAHIAGHYNEADDLIIDTHGADIIDPVWKLLDVAYAEFGVFPTLVERDFNIPALSELMQEVEQVRTAQARFGSSNTLAEAAQHG